MTERRHQVIEGSVLLRRGRQLMATSVLGRAIVFLLTPVPLAAIETVQETEAETQASLADAWRIVRASRLMQWPLSMVHAIERGWRHGRTAKAWRDGAGVDLHRRLYVAGWIVLTGDVISTASVLAGGRGWPLLWLLIQVAVAAASVAVIRSPQRVAIAWSEFRR